MGKSDRDYVLPSSDDETMRLHIQGARLYGGTTFLDPYLDEKPTRVLDVGSGTGLMAVHAARRLPEARVVGLEPDDGRREWAREHADVLNMDFVDGTVEDIPFEDRSFDLVFCRFMLVHAPQPDRSLAEMKRVTRPGGRIVTHEMIHDGVWFSPPKTAFAAVLHAVIKIMEQRRMDPSMGLHTASGMIRLGLQHVTHRIWPHACFESEPIFEEYRRNWLDTFSSLNQMLASQFDPDEVERACAELNERREDGFLVALTGLSSGIVL